MTSDDKPGAWLHEKATQHANERCPEQGPEFIVWCMCRDDYVAGVEEVARELFRQGALTAHKAVVPVSLITALTGVKAEDD